MSDTRTNLTGNRRVTTQPISVEDWKGTYTLAPGNRFTVTEDRGEMLDIERDGLLSASMGGTISREEYLSGTAEH